MSKRTMRNRSEQRLGFRVWSGNCGSGAREARSRLVVTTPNLKPQSLQARKGARVACRRAWGGRREGGRERRRGYIGVYIYVYVHMYEHAYIYIYIYIYLFIYGRWSPKAPKHIPPPEAWAQSLRASQGARVAGRRAWDHCAAPTPLRFSDLGLGFWG